MSKNLLIGILTVLLLLAVSAVIVRFVLRSPQPGSIKEIEVRPTGIKIAFYPPSARETRITPNQKMDISHREGTLTFWINDRRWLKDRHKYIFWDKEINEAKIKVFKDSNMTLNVFIDHPSVGQQKLKTDVSDLDKDRDHFFALTWSPEEVVLYLNAKQSDIKRIIR